MFAAVFRRLSLAVLLLLSTGSLAQTSAQPAPVPPARIAAAQDLLQLAGVARQFETVLPMIMQQMSGVIINQKPNKKAEIEDALAAVAKEMIRRKQELIDQLAELYARTLTDEEISGLVTFYKSPVGKRFVELQPMLSQGSMVIGQRWGQSVGADVESALRRELKKRGIDL